MRPETYVKLSDRLLLIAEMVTDGCRIADIGTDHAWLPIWLCQQERIPSAIAMDVKEGPLSGAVRHIRAAGLEDRICVRLSDGLQELSPGEAESIVLTGMGGDLICRILSQAEDKLDSFREFILGPQSETFLVRSFLEDHGFRITQERMICEDGKFYVVIRTVPGGPKAEKMTGEEKAFGPCLLENKDPVLHEWLKRKKETGDRILRDLAGINTDSAMKRRQALQEERQLLEAALKRYEM